MSLTLNKNLTWIFTGLYVLGMLVIGVQLFFGDQISFLGNLLNVKKAEVSLHSSSDQLVIAYAYKPGSLEPTLFDPITRSYLADIYEGLVKTDRTLKIQPALAVSWGLIDENTWEFRLRPGIKFHDGTALTVDDVVSSLERAMSFEGSQLKTLLNTVSKVSVTGDRIRIVTFAPDPLLLNKLAVVYIFPSGKTDFGKPVGTGPYVLESSGQNEFDLKRFDGYWGGKPKYANVVLKAIANRSDRVAALEKGELQLLANVPPNVGCVATGYHDAAGCNAITNSNVEIKSVPSLEVSYLAFNRDLPVFQNVDVRKAMAQAFDSQEFVDLAYGFARPVGQFVSNGVFGFNPEIERTAYDPAAAKKTMQDYQGTAIEQIEVTFDYPESLEAIGQYVQGQLAVIGISVKLNPLSDVLLQSKIAGGTSEMYFLGWRSELGDALDFLQSAAHSRQTTKGYGQFNGINYSNEKVDGLIERSQQNFDEESRLKDMQEAMKILVQDDIYGVPLFESETIFANTKDIQFEPRVDGYVHASEIK
jgi:peptide/nickel transport system substrate-binding protein